MNLPELQNETLPGCGITSSVAMHRLFVCCMTGYRHHKSICHWTCSDTEKMFAKHGAVSRQRSGTPPFGLITTQGCARALLPCAHMLFLIACVCSLDLLPSVRYFTNNAAACGPQDYMRVPPLRVSDCLLVADHSAHLSTLGAASPVRILRFTHWTGEQSGLK